MSTSASLEQAEHSWVLSRGALSTCLIRRVQGVWGQELCLGASHVEPPWDLIRSFESQVLLGEGACSRRLELASTGVKSAALILVSEDLLAWITSARPGWFPSSDLFVSLRWLGASREEVPAGEPGHRASADTSGVAHDLRNQLSLALLRLEMVRSESMDDVSAVRGALRSGRAMCNAFLGADETNADYQLAPLVEQEVRGAVDLSASRKVKVSIRCGARVLVHAPESALRRFLHNAMMNAIEASPDGSKILVEVLSAGPGHVEIAVEDQGVGLGSAAVASSFAAGISGRGSTGIGTASLRDAAAALGSSLVVSTGQGLGSRISVRVNTARADRPVAVLLDSDPVLSVAVRAALEAKGWWVIQESSEDAAVSAVDRLGAKLCVARRGAPGGGVAALREASTDLAVPFCEVAADSAAGALPRA